MPDSTLAAELSVDPVEFVAEVERVWQARDGVAAAAGYTPDAIVYYGANQIHRGEDLRAWPARWFAYAKDLQIKKTYRAHHGNCIASTWESRYISPETGKPVRERGAELFFLRGDKVCEHHMWQHSWNEGDKHDSKGFSTA
jgi:nuclear transport factor 2 (NTF2) superfamily protein